MKRYGIALMAFVCMVPAAAMAVNFTYENYTANVKIGDLNDPSPTVEVKCLLTNNETTSQMFHLHKDEFLPSFMWTAPLCVNAVCYSPYLYDTTDVIAPGATDTLKIWFNGWPGDEGTGTIYLSVWPEGIPAETVVETLVAITNGCDVLVVDDDGDQSYETYYTDALSSGRVPGVWPRSVQAVADSELAVFPAVFWLTGEEAPTLDGTDRTALASFLDGGGKLFLSGQNIAYDLCDPGSPNQSGPACAFLTTYLGAAYGADNSGSTDVSGDSHDPIGDGLSFSIAGGAGNQSSPDGISPAGDGDRAFHYDTPPWGAGVHRAAGDERVVYLSFGLEGITSSAIRQVVLDRVFAFFGATVGVASGGDALPATPALGANRPNPFNPVTSLLLRVPAASRATVRVYDAAGRSVKTLLDGEAATGETVLRWDGTDAGGSPVRSGVYFARMVAGNRVETRKMTLIR